MILAILLAAQNAGTVPQWCVRTTFMGVTDDCNRARSTETATIQPRITTTAAARKEMEEQARALLNKGGITQAKLASELKRISLSFLASEQDKRWRLEGNMPDNYIIIVTWKDK